MMLQDTEAIALQLIALVIVAAFLLAIADTPAYPLALGVGIIALIAVLMHGGYHVLTNLDSFTKRVIG